MATKALTLLNGTTADANEVMLLIDPLYTDIDETNVDQTAIVVASGNVNQSINGNKTLTGTTTLAATIINGALTAAGATFSGNVAFDTDTFYVDATNNRVYVGAASSIYPDYQLQNIRSTAGGYRGILIYNLDNTNTASHAAMSVAVGGAAAGDPMLLLDVAGVQTWHVAVDNSDSDKCKIGASGTVGTNTMMTMDSTNNTGTILLGTQTGGAFSNKVTMANNGEMLLPDVDPPTANYLNRNSGARGWISYLAGTGIQSSYNVSSVTLGADNVVINWNLDSASEAAQVAVATSWEDTGSANNFVNIDRVSAGQTRIYVWNTTDGSTPSAPGNFMCVLYGDQ